MISGKSEKIIKKIYTLHDDPLQTIGSAKYLGLTLTSDLKWNTHISNTTRKANRVRGLLRRNLETASQTFKNTSTSVPNMEYAATVWSPHTAENINKLGMVQRRVARYTCNRSHNTNSGSEMIGHLGCESLAARRNNMRLQMM